MPSVAWCKRVFTMKRKEVEATVVSEGPSEKRKNTGLAPSGEHANNAERFMEMFSTA